MGKESRPSVDCFMPLYVGDFIRSTVGWTATEKGHYLTLLMIQWDAGSLKPGLSELERLSPGISDVWALLETKFPIGKDGLRRNVRLSEHHAAALETRKRRVLAGKKGGRPGKPGLSRALGGLKPGLSNAKAGPKQPEPEPEPQYSSSLRSEEFKQPTVVATTETRRPRSRSLPSDSISWSSSGGWAGITDEDRTAWRTAYPACDISGELARAAEWLKANPAKAKKSRWRAFVTSWLTRSQNRGGGQPSNRPGDRPAATGVSSRRWRDDACANMTDDQYAAWGRAQRPLGIARTLSNAISLRERNLDAQTTNARLIANAEVVEDGDEAGIEYEPEPVRDGWIGSDGRP